MKNNKKKLITVLTISIALVGVVVLAFNNGLISKLKSNMDSLLSTILVGNNFVNTYSSALARKQTESFRQHHSQFWPWAGHT